MIAEMKISRQVLREIGFFLVGGVIGLFVLIGVGAIMFRGEILPGVKVGGVEVGGYSQTEAIAIIEPMIEGAKLNLKYEDTVWEVPMQTIGIDVESAIEIAYNIGRRSFKIEDVRNFFSDNLDIPLEYGEGSVEFQEQLVEISEAVEVEVVPSSLAYEAGEIVITEGEDGVLLDSEKLREVLSKAVAKPISAEMVVPIVVVSAQITEETKEIVKVRAEALIDDLLLISYDDEAYGLGVEELLGFLSPTEDQVIAREKVELYVDSLTESVNRSPQNAKFTIENERVVEFAPHRRGLTLVVEESVERMLEALENLVESTEYEKVELVLITQEPKITTAEANNFGIVERLGKGESYYRGSIVNRVYNVGLAAERINGALVAPGEEFSFNGTLGDVSGATGFKTAYVISGGRTILGDGGGVCQDSTTLFRAVMDAGLPITERWAHAYRVGYYEQNAQPGFDATVYSPSKDFRFTNDTPGYLLVRATAYETERRLVMEIYGSSDGRVSYVSKARVWGVTPPPPDLYQDDPSLPAGVVKQVDWSAWGAKTAFDYEVKRGGETIFSKTYSSSFRPWQNVFLRGTGE